MKNFKSIQKIYMIGIGGASMSGLAIALKNFGYSVCGSDKARGEYIALLEQNAIEVYFEENFAKLAESDCVVYSAAIAPTHPEYFYAQKNAIPLVTRAQLLEYILRHFQHSVAVAGCHGKSSTSAMLMHMLQACTHTATMHIGAKDRIYNNFYFGGKEYFVTEACEYKQNFLTLHPEVAILLSTEADHMEFYTTIERLQESYLQFARQAKYLIAYQKDSILQYIKPTLTFGLEDNADVVAKHIYSKKGKYAFTLYIHGEEIGRVHLQVYGKFSIQHALASFAVAKLYNLDMQKAIAAIEQFKGIERRMEILQKDENLTVIADYAHHPTELKASIETAKKIATGKLYILFQPHTYSRTLYFFHEFVELLAGQEHILIYKTFAARERYRKKGSAKTLASAIAKHNENVVYLQSKTELKNILQKNLQKGDSLLCLGAGDIYSYIKHLVKKV